MSDDNLVDTVEGAFRRVLTEDKWLDQLNQYRDANFVYIAGTLRLDDLSRAALRAIESAGHRIVPVEPTEAMVLACKGALNDFIVKLSQQARDVNKRRHGGLKIDPRTKTVIRYQAMLAAAPKVTP